MRLNKKNKILELISTIEDGINYTNNKGGAEAQVMLKDCIEAITYIESNFENEDNVKLVIKKIKDKITSTIELINNNDVLKDKIKSIKVSINHLKNIIINEIDTQLEIAFMPYKVSMWDCMESVWKEASEDPNCDCYVVPIPYYELDRNGDLSKFYYEGNDFSNDIEITPYNLYDIENRQPDIIYIHNPYDDCNRLTMIDPRYFSKKLSKYTNMLVYIPYFVAGSYESKLSHENASLLPGIVNSTKVVVQSRTQQELFISNGHKSSKILNLGSPKFDATLLASKEKFKISSDWEEAIKGKTVFLLNTGITNLMSDKNWVKDIEQVLNSFINNSSCSLIWRLHPLTEVTIRTMRPNLAEEFIQLKNKILSSDNIIIDTNSDTYPAISISDALISDYSSVMFQYMITEKPILSLMEKKYTEENRIFAIDYLGNYYIEDMNIDEFKNLVINNNDYKKEERMSRFKNSITNQDGTCGKKIHLNIKKEILENKVKF